MKMKINNSILYENIGFAAINSIDGTLVIQIPVTSAITIGAITNNLCLIPPQTISVKDDDDNEIVSYEGYTNLSSIGYNGIDNNVTAFLQKP